MVVLGVRFTVGLGSADCEDGGRIEEQEILQATAAVLGGCGDRVLPGSCSVLSLSCCHIR